MFIKDLKDDFLKRANLILKDNKKLTEIEYIVEDLMLKCLKAFELREGVVVLNENLQIIDSDEIFNNWFGIKKEELLNKNITEMFAFELKDVVR